LETCLVKVPLTYNQPASSFASDARICNHAERTMRLGLLQLQPGCSSTQAATANSRALSAPWSSFKAKHARVAARAKKEDAGEYDLVTKMVGKLFGKAVVGE
jgi:hypothetical protein